jgi:hypothetical protein
MKFQIPFNNIWQKGLDECLTDMGFKLILSGMVKKTVQFFSCFPSSGEGRIGFSMIQGRRKDN